MRVRPSVSRQHVVGAKSMHEREGQGFKRIFNALQCGFFDAKDAQAIEEGVEPKIGLCCWPTVVGARHSMGLGLTVPLFKVDVESTESNVGHRRSGQSVEGGDICFEGGADVEFRQVKHRRWLMGAHKILPRN